MTFLLEPTTALITDELIAGAGLITISVIIAIFLGIEIYPRVLEFIFNYVN